MPKKRKAKKTKKTKVLKKTKNIRVKSKLKVEGKTAEKKSQTLGPDEKPEIKKIKKQPSEKRVYNF